MYDGVQDAEEVARTGEESRAINVFCALDREMMPHRGDIANSSKCQNRIPGRLSMLLFVLPPPNQANPLDWAPLPPI